jgi:LPS export ABC transporter protein LptC
MKRVAIKITLAATTVALCVGCSKRTPLEPVGFRPDMRINNFVSLNYQGGKLSWKLEAQVSSYYIDENRTIAEGVVLNYFKDEKLTASIKADKAIINTNSRYIELIGNVDAITPAGHRLLTTKIQWNNQNKSLDTDEPVKIIRNNGDIIEGTGLRANYNLEDYEIKKRVKAITSSADSIMKKGK